MIDVPRIDGEVICVDDRVVIAAESMFVVGDGLSNHIDKGRSADEGTFINIAIVAQKLYAATDVIVKRNTKYRRLPHLFAIESCIISLKILFVIMFPELLLFGILEVVGRDLSSGVEILFRNNAILDDEAS